MKVITKIRQTALAALGVAIFSATPVAAQEMGDAAAGERLFARCAACHAVGPGAGNGVGPTLNGVFCRPIGSVEDYTRYSDAMQTTAGQGGSWNVAELNSYLEDPSKYLGGRSRMGLKLRKEDDRLNVIAFLAGINADGTMLGAGDAAPQCE